MLGAAQFLPFLVVGLPAGAIIDRLVRKRRLLVAADCRALGRAALRAGDVLGRLTDTRTALRRGALQRAPRRLLRRHRRQLPPGVDPPRAACRWQQQARAEPLQRGDCRAGAAGLLIEIADRAGGIDRRRNQLCRVGRGAGAHQTRRRGSHSSARRPADPWTRPRDRRRHSLRRRPRVRPPDRADDHHGELLPELVDRRPPRLSRSRGPRLRRSNRCRIRRRQRRLRRRSSAGTAAGASLRRRPSDDGRGLGLRPRRLVGGRRLARARCRRRRQRWFSSTASGSDSTASTR